MDKNKERSRDLGGKEEERAGEKGMSESLKATTESPSAYINT